MEQEQGRSDSPSSQKEKTMIKKTICSPCKGERSVKKP